MSDIVLPCETYKAKRFKKDVLKVKFQNKNIDDILNMTLKMLLIFLLHIIKKE